MVLQNLLQSFSSNENYPILRSERRNSEEERIIGRFGPTSREEETSDRDAMVVTMMVYLESSVGVD